jgi:hypothetical protein
VKNKMVLDKKKSLYDRDEVGNLVPKEVKLAIDEEFKEQSEFENDTVFMIPMTRGEIRKMFSEIEMSKKDIDKDLDGDIIIKYVKNPAFTLEDIKVMKPALATVLVNTVFRESGLDTGKGRKKAMLAVEDDFAKNL